LYNIPQLTKTAYEPATVVRLAELPGVVGMKDSSGDLQYLRRLRERVTRDDWSYFAGTELHLAEAVRGGAHGCVGGGANVDPGLLVSLYDAAVRGDTERAAALQARLALLDRIYRLGAGTGSIIRGIKCALSCMEVCSDRMGEPLRACTAGERAEIERYLADLGLCTPKSKQAPGASHETTAAAVEHGVARVGAGVGAAAAAGR
jgi:4-hydroxy-tetrahydrodipicolinate synthase